MMKRAGVDDQIIQNLFLSIRKQPMARSFMLQKQESVILRKKTLPVTIWTISLLYLWDIMAAGIMIRLSCAAAGAYSENIFQPGQFIIVGTRPLDGSVDSAALTRR